MPRLPRAFASSSRSALSFSSSLRPQPSTLLARAPPAAPAPAAAASTPTSLISRSASTLFRPSGARPLLPSLRPSLSSPVLSLLAAASPRPEQHQVRTAVYGAEYQPSQVRRKRKHGFLVRKKSKAGRRTLARRWGKGRKFLSH
ncbi:hypothetical protein DMC30DRAFT_156078 [Rhodotorula diobovata]|uniref:Large ribosomal subunit protein bL34m n=1 Tax=Rhodotorula diobovata TaxID=5288 RepID=A0A5C5FZJ3_9BASI|nr:hypothetical protein DMC30DRAFT_156078 [Rhodotorula diobovata]